MSGNAIDINDVTKNLAGTEGVLDQVQKKAEDGSSASSGGDLVSGAIDVAGEIADSAGSELLDGAIEVAGNVLGGVLEVAGDLLSGIFD